MEPEEETAEKPTSPTAGAATGKEPLKEEKNSLNGHYGNTIGFIQTFSLLLNAGLMVYAHVGLSGVVYSSQDPNTLATPATGVDNNNNNTTNSTHSLGGQCQADTDLQIWVERGGLQDRPQDSNYCAREYGNSGCLLDTDCLSECFQQEFGYSAGCSDCFAALNPCVSSSPCLLVCATDAFSQECATCMRGTTCDQDFFECTGLPQETSEACTAEDEQIWNNRGGLEERPKDSNYCSREYNGNGCLLDTECLSECFEQELGYSSQCSDCFAALNPCVSSSPCLLVCAADAFSQECATCMDGTTCDADFFACTGLSQDIGDNNSTNLPTLSPTNDIDAANQELAECTFDDLSNVEEWYPVYDLTFVGSIRDAWNANVEFLAILIIVFSGIWPYAKNIILIMIWYIPMTDSARSYVLLWLTRLSKYTLVDVFAVVIVLVGVQLDLNVGGTVAITRAEARFAILAFLLATVWEFIQIEWMKIKHDQYLALHKNNHNKTTHSSAPNENESQDNQEGKEETSNPHRFAMTVALWLLAVGLYVAGASIDIFKIENYDFGTSDGCILSYNLGTISTALVNDVSFADNQTKGQSWTLFFFYIIFVFIFPISVHLLQISYLVLPHAKRKHTIGHLTGILWGISSVEVFLIGLFAVEYKFHQFVYELAGEEGAQFIDVESYLGPGFYVLIVYSVVAGLLQYYLRIWWIEKEQQ